MSVMGRKQPLLETALSITSYRELDLEHRIRPLEQW